MFEALIAAFVVTFLSEIADKTQLVVFGLAMNFKSAWRVFIGALLGHVVMDGIAIAFGSTIAIYLAIYSIKPVIAICFVLLGLATLAKLFLFKKTETEVENKQSKKLSYGPILASFLTILLSEAGDKTQVSAALIAAKYQQPFEVLAGLTLAIALAILINVHIGKRVAHLVPEIVLKIGTAMLFIVFGLATYLL